MPDGEISAFTHSDELTLMFAVTSPEKHLSPVANSTGEVMLTHTDAADDVTLNWSIADVQ